jgi:hypothetical protein
MKGRNFIEFYTNPKYTGSTDYWSYTKILPGTKIHKQHPAMTNIHTQIRAIEFYLNKVDQKNMYMISNNTQAHINFKLPKQNGVPDDALALYLSNVTYSRCPNPRNTSQ